MKRYMLLIFSLLSLCYMPSLLALPNPVLHLGVGVDNLALNQKSNYTASVGLSEAFDEFFITELTYSLEGIYHDSEKGPLLSRQSLALRELFVLPFHTIKFFAGAGPAYIFHTPYHTGSKEVALSLKGGVAVDMNDRLGFEGYYIRMQPFNGHEGDISNQFGMGIYFKFC